MKKFLISLSLIFITLFSFNTLTAQRTCNATDVLERQLEEDPKRALQMENIERQVKQFMDQRSVSNRTVYTIPVVFHVVYNNAAENISDTQLMSQLDVLNEDFRRLNANANNNWSQAADTEIEFCLATIDPSGNATTGITRTQTSLTTFTDDDKVKFTAQGGKDAWPRGDYMNFWVCDLNGFLGYAQFPGGGASTDGVVCDYEYTGRGGSATAPFDQGRTGTHEVGHWLNLYHIWGDGGCNVDDNVADTPVSDAENYGCPSGHTSCGTLDMIENYMDYTDDACMNLFTQGQKTRMQSVLASGGFRASLANSTACGATPPPPTTCSTPTGLSNGSITASGATSTWSSVTGAVSYDFSYKATSATSWATQNVTSTSYTITGLSSCTAYETRVRAVCSSGNSSYTSSSNFTTTGCAPPPTTGCPAPTGLAASSITSNSAVATWASVSTALSYKFRYRPVGGSWQTQTVTTNSYNMAGLQSCTDYEMRVRAVCSSANGGNSAYSAFVTFTTTGTGCGGTTPPATCNTPTGLSNGSITASGATATWNSVTGVVSYDFEYKLTSATSWTSQNVISTSYTITGLSSCTAYETRVRAVCSSGNSLYTSSSNFTTTGCTPPPTTGCPVPTGLAAGSITANSAVATWASVSTALSYKFRYRPVGGSWQTQTVTTNSYNMAGLQSCTDYEMRVRAVCSSANGGNSAYSAFVTFTTTGTGCGGTTPPPTTTCNDNEVTYTLITDDYGSETSWELKDASGIILHSGNNYGNNQTHVFNWCLPNGCYDFTINDSYGDGICCANGNGSYELKNSSGTVIASGGQFGSSETKNFCFGSTPPPPPTTGSCTDIYESNDVRTDAKTIAADATIQAKIGSSTDVDWFKVKTTNAKRNIKVDLTNLAANYDLELSYGNTVVGTSNNSGTQNEQIIYNETRRRTYYIKVYGVGGANSSDCYDLTTTISSSSLRGSEIVPVTDQRELDKLNLRFAIAPNPATDVVNLRFSPIKETTLKINVLDTRGKVILQKEQDVLEGNQIISVNTSSLTSGMYFIKVTDGKAVNTEKLIIAKQ